MFAIDPYRKPLAVAVSLLLALYHPQSHGAEVKARSADDFVDSIGVAGHFTKTNSPYSTNYHLPSSTGNSLRHLIQELGIRHVRTGAPAAFSERWINERIMDLYHGLGIRSVLVVDRRIGPTYNDNSNLNTDQAGIDNIVANLAGRNHAIYPPSATSYFLWPAIEAIEGPNEYDISNNAVRTGTGAVTDLVNWAPSLQTFMSRLQSSVAGQSVLNSVPIIAPALLVPEFLDEQSEANPVSAYIDAGNGHCYGVNPDRPEKMQRFHHLVVEGSRVWPNKELWMTETGYTTAINEADGQGISEKAQRKYHGRMLAQAFHRGVKRTFLYELCDQWVDLATENDGSGSLNRDGIAKNNGQAAFGLIALTNTSTPPSTPIPPSTTDRHQVPNSGIFTLRRKPAFHALRNLISILKDPGAPYYAGSLDFTLDSSFNIGHLLLQKRDGKFYLVLWNQAQSYSYNFDANGNRQVPGYDNSTNINQTVRVHFTHGVTQVRQRTPGLNADTTGALDAGTQSSAVSTADPNSFDIVVPDELTILEITPSLPRLAAGKNVVFEAETASSQSLFGPLEVVKYAGARAQEFVQVPVTAGYQGSLGTATTGQFQFSFTTAGTGNITAWYRVNFPDETSNSLYTQLNSLAVNQLGTVSTGWAWRQVTWNAVAAGTHVLKIGRREAGAAIDQVQLSFVASGSNPFRPTLTTGGSQLFFAESAADQAQFRPFIVENVNSTANGRRIVVPNSPAAIGPPSGAHPYAVGSDGNIGPANSNQGTMQFQFDVSDSATFPLNVYVHLDRAAPNGTDDSFYLQHNNNGAWLTLNGITGTGWYKYPTPFTINSAGPHTIKVQWRENGTYLYRAWFTTSATATPPN
jgi:hypothetical protein